jgi:hypothetical protein
LLIGYKNYRSLTISSPIEELSPDQIVANSAMRFLLGVPVARRNLVLDSLLSLGVGYLHIRQWGTYL